MSASNQYKSTQSSCCNNSSCEDEENYITSSKCLKYEDDQIYVTEENSDSFSEKRGLVSNKFSLQSHEKTYQIQQQKLNAIKNLIDTSDQQYCQQFGNNITESHPLTSFVHSQLQNSEYNYQSQACSKSKKEILKEKRDKKKMQIQEKKQAIQIQEEQAEKKKEYSKEEKAERQKIKNRESAQLSRDRKKLLENQMQQDLKFLTDENKQLQSMINQHYTCQQCGFFNNPSSNTATTNTTTDNNTKQQYQNCKANHIQLTTDSIQQRYQQGIQNIDQANQQGTDNNPNSSGAVYQFFDFSRTSAPIMAASPINLCSFGKGAWSTAFVIFIIYMMLVFSGSQQDGNGTLGSNFRNLQFVGPNAQLFEQYKNLTQEELLEELLKQIQLLKEQEKDEQLKQLKLIQMLANAAVTLNHTPGTEEPTSTPELNELQKSNLEESEKDFIIEESQSQTSSSSTAANSALLEKIQALEKEVAADSEPPIQQSFLDFCQKYKEIQSNNEEERSYYKDLSKKLDELQREKLMQLESLKSIYCVSSSDTPFQGSNQAATAQKNTYENQMYNPKMQFPTPFFSEKQLNSNYLNPSVLQEQSLDKLRNTTTEQQNNNRQNAYHNSPPTFDNISQFFNDTASFREEGIDSSLDSSQSLDAVNNRQEQQFLQEQQQYQQYRSQVRQNNMQQQYYNNQNIEQFEENHENINMIGEEEDPFNVAPQINTKKPSINYYELMQKKSVDINNQQNQHQAQQQQYQQFNPQNQAYATQQIACQYSFQQNNFAEDFQNSNSTNSINLQSVQNGKIQQFNLLFSPQYNSGSGINNKDDAHLLHNDVEKYIKFQCKFVDSNCIQKDNY
ncbi:basic region leucine zipper protein (macronuclear) [Tetrahymena thermophila SB210]|uniref:Basic region leucine zipper protein n=1 Tax=Tetrahymena thermophila (strain SB210) TaxID=312017 RepID=I7MGN6_TETTS|nr:basic region leucine zipper protein [Tetrahymena thermophila SB210]EAS01760.2 basic region leucine zipper protein [Tetrahymena thermophila SB210]|eukprot:XP_001022005.2 basic region leucine zipper protein [Tetrahymena thermophila SB210]